jgi:hypothetical protein
MAVGHLTYLDLPPEQRKEAAERLRTALRASLSSPFTAPEQRVMLTLQMDFITAWENGQLTVGTAPPVPVRALPEPESKS